MQAVASISSGTLSIQINAQLYDTGLTDAISTNILNHVETILDHMIIPKTAIICFKYLYQDNFYYLF